ncbi:transposase [Malikia spinosa]|uniref:transposase n=1 Tax=Malikia spinosa TaxID=86180 RepID=UPI00136BD140
MVAHAPQLGKKRDAAVFAQSSEELDKLRIQAQAGEIELAYLDEAGFAQVHPNRSAWTPRGEQHLIEAPSGKRLNVMVVLLSSGTVGYAYYWYTSTAELFLGFVNDLAQRVSKPLVIVLGNASIHRAGAIQGALVLFKKQGLKFEFLSPYSPELNCIEVMWRLMKHRWLAAKRRTEAELERAVEHVFKHFGSQFKMDF